jgi:hypothetical protein
VKQLHIIDCIQKQLHSATDIFSINVHDNKVSGQRGKGVLVVQIQVQKYHLRTPVTIHKNYLVWKRSICQ